MAGGRLNVACMAVLLVAAVVTMSGAFQVSMAAAAVGPEVVARPEGICCREYYDKGPCVPGEGDAPGGACYEFCIQECKGALCKPGGGSHHCHCLC